jgi:transmembrane sensor
MTPNDEQHLISVLICKQIVGKASEDERKIIELWRKESEWNEAAYQRLLDPEQMQMELSRSALTDYHRPLEEMKHRLGIDKKKPKSRNKALIYSLVTVAASVMLIIGSIFVYYHSAENKIVPSKKIIAKTEITHGTTCATLTIGNGQKITLGPNAAQNSKMIAQAVKGNKNAMNNLQTPRGGEFKVTLEDGTEVWLNAETTLRYPENFDGDARRVEVSGEAYFKVAHNNEKPFYVTSGKQEIRVYGTEFNVHAYPDEANIFTTLVAGSIALKPVNGNSSELMLSPGHQAVFSNSDESAKVRTVDTEIVTSWRSGTFVFENQTLDMIMKTLSRWYNFDYEFADKSISNTEFIGSIPKYGKFSDVVEIFSRMGDIHLRQHGRKVIISTK